MANDIEQLVLQISADNSQMMRVLKKMDADINASTKNITDKFRKAGQDIDQALTPLQKRINAMVGIPAPTNLKEWTGPLTTISEGLETTGRKAKLTANQMLNLSRQGNDVVTMFALGAPPMQIFASQAGQIYDALEQGPAGIKGSLKAIAENAASLAARFPVATAAIAAGTVAVIAYAAAGGSKLKSLDDILATHEANIKRLGDAYDEVAQKRQKYASDTANTVNALNEGSAKDARDLVAAQLKSVFDEVYQQVGAGGGNQGALQMALRSQFEPFSAAIEHLAEESRKAFPDIASVRDEITEIAKADPRGLNAAKDALLSLTEEVSMTAAALPDMARQVSPVDEAFAKLQAAIDDISSDSARKEVQDLLSQAKDGKIGIDEVASALATLSATRLDLSGQIGELGKLFKAAIDARNAVSNQQLTPLGQIPPVYSGHGQFQTEQDVMNDRADATKSQTQLAAEKAERSARHRTRQNDYQRESEQITKRTEEIEAQTDAQAQLDPLVNDYGFAVDMARTKQELLNAAHSAGLKITPELEKSIDAMATGYAKATSEAERLAERQQLLREEAEKFNDTARDALGGFINDLIEGKSATEALSDALKNVGQALIESGLNSLFDTRNGGSGGILGSIISSLFGGSSFGTPSGFADMLGLAGGGSVSGPGGPKGDKIPAWLSDGEFVVNSDAARKNRAFLEAINSGRFNANRFAVGGSVEVVPMPRIPTVLPAANSSVPNITYAPVNQFSGTSEELAQMRQIMDRDRREFSANVLNTMRTAKKTRNWP